MEQICALYVRARCAVVCRCQREDGASLVEYALLVSLIAVVCIASIAFLGRAASGKFSSVGSAIK